ncbi:MAG: hypothetical protein JXL80_09650 [Planctomycetes bacterium]|nr:hypothetical protein [Planctomycetota bacterium]
MCRRDGIILILLGTLCVGHVCGADGAASSKAEAGNKGGSENTELYFKITAEGQPVGSRHIKSTKTDKGIVIEDKLTLKYRDKMASFRSTVSYTLGEKPEPIHAEASTFIGDKKLMEGTLDFAIRKGEDGQPQRMMQIKVTGFFSKRLEEYSPPKEASSEMACPEGWPMFMSAMFCLVPQMEPKDGMLTDVVSMEFPDDLDFPELLNAKKGYAVKWIKGEDGTRTILMGPRAKVEDSSTEYARLVLDADGKIKEYRMEELVLQPCSKEEALKAATPQAPRQD